MVEVEFLFDNQLIAGLEKLIRSAKKELLLVSPFIDLDERIVDALNEKKSLHNFTLRVLFGKNEYNYLKSIRKDSLAYLRQFPNVEIRYNDRLHAKFYANDFEYIVTSLNLYDYSLGKNIEVGARGQYASKGVLHKALDVSASLIEQGVDKMKESMLGISKDIDIVQKFDLIFGSSSLMYKTEAIVAEKGGLQGMLGHKKLEGFNILENNFEKVSPAIQIKQKASLKATTKPEVNSFEEVKTLSASQLSKQLSVLPTEIINLMQRHGLIINEKITDKGIAKGLIIRKYMGKEYIAYPENLQELKELRR